MTTTVQKAYWQPPQDTVIVAAWLGPIAADQLSVPLDGALRPEDLHITLEVAGSFDDLDMAQVDALMRATRTVATRRPDALVTAVRVATYPTEGGQFAIVVEVDSPDLDTTHTAIRDELAAEGIAFPQREFPKHVTIAYLDEDPNLSEELAEQLTFWIYGLTIAIGPHRLYVPFETGGDIEPMLRSAPHEDTKPGLLRRIGDAWRNAFPTVEQDDRALAVASPLLKSATVEEDRYTFAPLYIPSADDLSDLHLDAHDEFATVTDLQKSVWSYMRKGDRRIYLQHMPSVLAGEFVELATWPYEVEAELIVPGDDMQKAESKTVTLPPGTPYMGTIWRPWAWDLVKRGKLRGYSIGGQARRIEVDFGPDVRPPEPVVPAMT